MEEGRHELRKRWGMRWGMRWGKRGSEQRQERDKEKINEDEAILFNTQHCFHALVTIHRHMST